MRESLWARWVLGRPVAVLLLVGIPAFLLNFFAGRAGISGWDANYYFSYAAAVANNGTLDLEPVYTQMVRRGADPVAFDPAKRTATGQVYNFYPIGHPLLHAPATVLGRFVGGALGEENPATGVAAQLFFCLSAIAAGAGGIWLMHREFSRWFGATASAVAVYTLFGTSMLGYYWFVLPALSHTSSLLAAGLIVWLMARLLDDPAGAVGLYAALGTALALAVMIRLQDIGVGIFAVALLARLRSLGGREATPRAVALVGAGVLVFSLQLLHWRWREGMWLPRQYNDYSYFDFGSLNHLNVLFSLQHGLLLWHPIFLMALVGVYFFWRTGGPGGDRRFGSMLWFGAFLGVLLVGGFYSIWWFGDSFGSRPFLSVLPLFWIGIAWIWSRMAQTQHGWIVYTSTAVSLTLWNGFLAIVFHLGWISRSGPLDLSPVVERLLR